MSSRTPHPPHFPGNDSDQAYLTERQKEILEYISQYQAERGISPTQREIRDHFGYSSYGTVYKHLRLLQEKGFLQRDRNQKRGLQLVRAATEAETTSTVPFLGLIAAGHPIETLSEPENLSVPSHLFGGLPDDHFVLKVVGDSMIQEGIHDGDFVVVLRRERARTAEMVVALVNGEVTLKRFYPEGAKVRLQPANPTMEPIWVAAQDVQVQGVVVGLMRKY